MGRHAFPIGARALRAAQRYQETGVRAYRRGRWGKLTRPSLRQIARYLRAQRLTLVTIHPMVLCRALRRGVQS
jgi:hypothetical protein